jgi:deoxyribodipyrimidine photolyase
MLFSMGAAILKTMTLTQTSWFKNLFIDVAVCFNRLGWTFVSSQFTKNNNNRSGPDGFSVV